MIDLLFTQPHLFWLSLGGLLLVAEMLIGNGYLLWSGVAALITGLLVWIIPFDREWQGVLFAALTMIVTWLWWRWLTKKARGRPDANNQLNQRGQQLVGQIFTLDNTLINGRGHVRVGDSSWPVIADSDLAAGTQVEVLAVEGITLRVRART